MLQGDLVVRRSYGGDVVFKVDRLYQHKAVLRGYEYRLLADAPLSDLLPVDNTRQEIWSAEERFRIREFTKHFHDFQQKQREKYGEQRFAGSAGRDTASYFELPGKVLHLDGDPAYLRKSMSLYGELKIPAEGHYVPEESLPQTVQKLLPEVRPDIVVMTGHDGLLKDRGNRNPNLLSSYKNSAYFVNAVRAAREYEHNRDQLVVIAGACQSHFEALLMAGSNFASSPGRILIHALDPVYVACKMSYMSIRDTVNILEVIQHTMSGMQGLGGVECRGSYRIGLPRLNKNTSSTAKG